MLPRRVRAHLLAVYGFARLVDELGDSAPGDRLASLDWLERELDRAYAGCGAPADAALGGDGARVPHPAGPFDRLIEANRTDQRVLAVRHLGAAAGYCALSADPVGEMVLTVFGAATPAADRVVRFDLHALQLAEHCRRVAEDFGGGPGLPARSRTSTASAARSRSWAPASTRERPRGRAARAGRRCAGRRCSPSRSRARARLLDAGLPLLDELRGRARLGRRGVRVAGAARRSTRSREPATTCSRPARASSARAWRAGLRRPAAAGCARGRTWRPLRASACEGLAGARHECRGTAGATSMPMLAASRRAHRAANFYYGIRLLPRGRRRAMCAVYAFARRIDDIGDGG